MKQKIILLVTLIMVAFLTIFFTLDKKENNSNEGNNRKENDNLISVLVDGVEQSAFPSKGSAEYQSTSCTNGETAVWDATNWKLSIQDISASTRCVVSFVTGGHNVYVTVSGGTVDNAPKQVNHNGNTTFTVASSNSNYVFSSVKCTGVNSYSWANNVLSVNGVTADAYCDVVFSRPTYTVYFNVTGGFTEHNYVSVVRGGGNSTTFGAIAGYLTSGATITCDPGIEGRLAGTRIVVSNVMSSGDCNIVCSRDTSNYLPGGATYIKGDEVSYANLSWLVVGSDAETVTLILKGNASYTGTSGSNPTGTGIYGSGVVFTSSSARSYLQDIWLEQVSQQYLKSAIDSGGLVYQSDANGYVRLPYAAESDTTLPNASNTNYWTMDNDGAGHVYYGQPSGYLANGKATDNKYYFEYYTLASNTSVSYSWASKITGSFVIPSYYSTTCAYVSNCTCSGSAYGAYYCNGSSGPTSFNLGTCSCAGNARYASCAGGNPGSGCSGGVGTNDCGGYPIGCASTCSNINTRTSTANATCSLSTNPVSGGSYNPGSYSNGYKKWVKNVGTEVNSSTATKGTTLTYSSTTTGNSGMTASVQAVSPTASSARINDSVPTTSSITITATTHTALTGESITGTFYQGFSTSSCDAIKTTTLTTSIAAGAGTCVAPTKTYVRYTLQDYNTSTMGYRPVIVVKKAN